MDNDDFKITFMNKEGTSFLEILDMIAQKNLVANEKNVQKK